MNSEKRTALSVIEAIDRAARGDKVVKREIGRLLDVLGVLGWQTDELDRTRRKVNKAA